MTLEINEYDLSPMAMGKRASEAFSKQMNVGFGSRCPKCGSDKAVCII